MLLGNGSSQSEWLAIVVVQGGSRTRKERISQVKLIRAQEQENEGIYISEAAIKNNCQIGWKISIIIAEYEKTELSFNLYYFQKYIFKNSLLILDFLTNRVIAISLTKISFHQTFYTIQMLMVNVLGLDTCKHYKERQTNLQNKVMTLLDEKFYCLLNDIFHVQVTSQYYTSARITMGRHSNSSLVHCDSASLWSVFLEYPDAE